MTDEEIYDLYVNKELGAETIARMSGLNPSTVRRRLVAMGVEMRRPGYMTPARRAEHARRTKAHVRERMQRFTPRDDQFVAAIFAAHPLGYFGPWYDKARGGQTA